MESKVLVSGINMNKIKICSSEEIQNLFKRLENGDMSARDLIVNGNLRLVLRVVQYFKNKNISGDDLFQIGCMGLIKAVDNFDRTKNYQFSTYAVPMIMGEIKRFLRDNNDSVHVSRNIKLNAYKIIKAKEDYIKKNLKEPTISELMEIVEMDKETILLALESNQEIISLQQTIQGKEDDKLSIMDQVKDDIDYYEDCITHISLQEVINGLKEKEQLVIKLRFFKDKTQSEVAKELNISQAHISRIEKIALQKMKEQFA